MANGRTGGSRTIGYIIGGIVLLLILAWLFGLFGGDDDVAEDAAEDAAEATEEAADEAEDAAD